LQTALFKIIKDFGLEKLVGYFVWITPEIAT
jgi:hypothetical protein